jgi:hypothetical protein
MLLHELLAGDIYPSNPPLTHQAANTYTCSCCYHFQSVPNFAGSSQVNPHRSHWRQIVPPKGRKTLTNPSRGRRPRKAAAAPGLGGPPRRPAAGRCTGKQQRSQHRTLHIKKSRFSLYRTRRGERGRRSADRSGRGCRRLLRPAAGAEGGRCRSSGGTGEGWRRRRGRRRAAWRWGPWSLASPWTRSQGVVDLLGGAEKGRQFWTSGHEFGRWKCVYRVTFCFNTVV